MISIDVFYDDNNYLKQMQIEGHAGVKNQSGYEVCIAISSISQAMVFALKGSLENKNLIKVGKKSGYLRFDCKTAKLSKYNLYVYAIISKAFIDCIKDLSKQYKNFIDYKEYYN